MKTSVTVTFSALFILVAAFYLRFGAPLPKPENPAMPETVTPAKLLDLQKEDTIDLIQLQRPDDKETITLARAGGNWQIQYPVVYPADQMVANGLLAALRVSHKARRLVREKGWEEYGLLKPDLKIGIETHGHQKRKYLFLGDRSPVAALIYARWDGEEEYFLLDERFKKAFDKSLYSLREKRLIRMPLKDISKIRVRTSSETFELTGQDEKWVWARPAAKKGSPVSDEMLYKIFSGLKDLHIKEFLDGEPLQEEARGFSEAGPSIQVWDKNKKTVTFRLGQAVPEHDAYDGLLDGEKVVLEIARGNADHFFDVIASERSERSNRSSI